MYSQRDYLGELLHLNKLLLERNRQLMDAVNQGRSRPERDALRVAIIEIGRQIQDLTRKKGFGSSQP